ncbi:hypothetical protein [Christiangramia aquimixticola]|uniref:hypothetical protein n=1 Tax=Christiangramia aquimixticola TaxID=1697558 RepID=UPI003AA83218
MRLLIFLLPLIFIPGFSSCNSSDIEDGSIYKGTIQKSEVTTYQYGTHVLITSENRYALKSETLDLNDYIEKTITIKAEKIPGYPVDGGPEYLNVLKILK